MRIVMTAVGSVFPVLVGAVIIMALAAVAGIFAGAALGDPLGGAILLTLIAGIGCIVYAIDNRDA